MPIWFLSRESWHVREGEGYEGNKALFSLLNHLIVTSRQRFVLRWDKSFMSDNKRVSGHSSHPTGRSSDIKKDFRFLNYVWSQLPEQCGTELMHLENVCPVSAQIPEKSALTCETMCCNMSVWCNRLDRESIHSSFGQITLDMAVCFS